MLETIGGQNVQKSAIETAGFALTNPIGGGQWNTTYIEGQWQSLVQQEAISFAIQAMLFAHATGNEAKEQERTMTVMELRWIGATRLKK